MVAIIKRKKGKRIYYYLKHSVRKNNRQKEIYLGKTIPKNIDEIKQNFLLEFYRQEWLPSLERIREGYKKERKRLPKDVIDREMEAFSISFTYNTQRIEGSTLTLRETADLLAEGIAPSNKPMRDVKEAEAHQRLFFEILKYKPDLSLKSVCQWHKKMFEETKPAIAGRIRDYQVRIGGSKFIPPRPEAITLLLREFFSWYKKNKGELNPVELSALVHLKFVTIHPFGDGNGRISRLMMNYVLGKLGYPMLDIAYGERRSYYNALERSQIRQNDVIFLQWFMKRYFKTYKKFLTRTTLVTNSV
jgi:Fic family protein